MGSYETLTTEEAEQYKNDWLGQQIRGKKKKIKKKRMTGQYEQYTILSLPLQLKSSLKEYGDEKRIRINWYINGQLL